MNSQGKVSNWDEGRGFGFIQPDDGSSRVFLHISDFDRRYQRPAPGMAVRYQLGTDKRGRPRAQSARPLRGKRQLRLPQRQRRRGLLLVFVFFTGLAGLSLAGSLPWSITCYYLALSLFTLLVYAVDKRAALRGHWRTREQTLHILSLLGGWPGAALAQGFLRHKSSKTSFLVVYWLTVCLNLAALAYGLTAEGMHWVRQFDDVLMSIPAVISSFL